MHPARVERHAQPVRQQNVRVRPSKPGLVDQISAVLKHPETPTSLYNAMSGVLTDMQGNIDRDTQNRLFLRLKTR